MSDVGRAEAAGGPDDAADSRGQPRTDDAADSRGQPRTDDAADARGQRLPDGGVSDPYDRRTTVVARTVARVVVPVILLTSISLLLQGHNLPGGGFIGGVLTATAFVLVYVIFGLDYLGDVLGLSGGRDGKHGPVAAYRWLFGVGLALALGAGIAPVLLGFPFLTQAVVFLEHLPVYGELEVASALAFDLGVYLTVVGALLTVLGEVGSE